MKLRNILRAGLFRALFAVYGFLMRVSVLINQEKPAIGPPEEGEEADPVSDSWPAAWAERIKNANQLAWFSFTAKQRLPVRREEPHALKMERPEEKQRLRHETAVADSGAADRFEKTTDPHDRSIAGKGPRPVTGPFEHPDSVLIRRVFDPTRRLWVYEQSGQAPTRPPLPDCSESRGMFDKDKRIGAPADAGPSVVDSGAARISDPVPPILQPRPDNEHQRAKPPAPSEEFRPKRPEDWPPREKDRDRSHERPGTASNLFLNKFSSYAETGLIGSPIRIDSHAEEIVHASGEPRWPRFFFPETRAGETRPSAGERPVTPAPDVDRPWPELANIEPQTGEDEGAHRERLMRLELEQKGSLWSVSRF